MNRHGGTMTRASLVLAFTLLLALAGCGNRNAPPPVANPVSLDIQVRYPQQGNRSLYLMVHDRTGNLLQTHVIDTAKPSPQTLHLDQVPEEGYVTAAQITRDHRTWPVEGDYDALYVTSSSTKVVERLQDFAFYFSDWGWVGYHYTNHLEKRGWVGVSGSCPSGATELMAYDFDLGWYTFNHVPCQNGSIVGNDMTVGSDLQTDGKMSLVLWAMKNWTQPMGPYVPVLDHDPTQDISITASDYQSATRTWTVRVIGVPPAYQDLNAYYYVVGVRKGATLAGYSTRNQDACQGATSDQLCAHATTADLGSQVEARIMRVGLERDSGGFHTISLLWKPVNSLSQDQNVSFSEFEKPFESWSISPDLRKLQLSGGASGVSQIAHLEAVDANSKRFVQIRVFSLDAGGRTIVFPALPRAITQKFPTQKSAYGDGWMNFTRFDRDHLPPYVASPLDQTARTLVVFGSWGSLQSLGRSGADAVYPKGEAIRPIPDFR